MGQKKSKDSIAQKVSNANEKTRHACPVVGIGASAGGLEAFSTLLNSLPDDTGLGFVLVQHLDPQHESALAEILGSRTNMPVVQARNETLVECNHVYVIPPNTTMSIAAGKLCLEPRGARGERYMPIDSFLFSLAADQKNQAFGVILSGSASDGTLGLKAIKDEGGITFAQDERTARFSSMPRNAVAMGAVDFVLPPDEIAREIASIARHTGNLPPLSVAEPEKFIDDGPQFQSILALVREHSGVDFTHYKHATIRRRFIRRMAMQRAQTLSAYFQLLTERPPELSALFEDLLINVTEFFRDPATFEFLRGTAIPELLSARSPQTPVRVWVPACSTGEEVYSLAICLREAMEAKGASWPIQIFGTDVSETVIEKARLGIYADTVTGAISPERLRKYFVRLENGHQIHPSIREHCIFSRHNVTKDPPLSRMDIISCRNLLIYLGPLLQKRVLIMFHYALQSSGFLVLGASESLGPLAGYFNNMDKREKVFSPRPGERIKTDFAERVASWPRYVSKESSEPSPNAPDSIVALAQREADRALLGRYAPAGFLVDDNLKIVEFRGRVAPYLGPAPGEASYHLLRMLADELIMPVRSTLDSARQG